MLLSPAPFFGVWSLHTSPMPAKICLGNICAGQFVPRMRGAPCHRGGRRGCHQSQRSPATFLQWLPAIPLGRLRLVLFSLLGVPPKAVRAPEDPGPLPQRLLPDWSPMDLQDLASGKIQCRSIPPDAFRTCTLLAVDAPRSTSVCPALRTPLPSYTLERWGPRVVTEPEPESLRPPALCGAARVLCWWPSGTAHSSPPPWGPTRAEQVGGGGEEPI